MKKFLILMVMFITVPFSVLSQENDIVISDQWARPILVMGRPGGAYFKIKNNTSSADKLLSASSSLAPRVEVHEHSMIDGVMKMSQVQYVDIPAGGTVDFKPGGYHVMLFEVREKYGEGDTIDLTLTFEKAGSKTIQIPVMVKKP